MWIKLDDHFDQHPKLQRVGPLGIAVWVASIAYCNRNLTDGFIPWSAARCLLSWEFLEHDSDKGEKVWECSATSGMMGIDTTELTALVTALLTDAGLWVQVSGGYMIHDYLDYQPSKDMVLRTRKVNAQRQARHKVASANGVTNGPVTLAPYPVPVPAPTPEKIESKSTEKEKERSLREKVKGAPRRETALERINREAEEAAEQPPLPPDEISAMLRKVIT